LTILLSRLLFTAVVAAAQVITRLNLTWEGHIRSASDPPLPRRSAFRTIVLILVLEWVIDILLRLAVRLVEGDALDPETSARFLMCYPLFLLSAAVLWKERSVKKGVITVFFLFQVLWIFELYYGFDKKESSNISYIGRYLHELTFYGSFTVNAMIIRNVRHYVRAKYDIPAAWFASGNTEEPSFDDFHLAVFSPNLATMQLLRHTTDYRKYGCRMCSERGLPRGAPGIV
jgi:hypothetical protein